MNSIEQPQRGKYEWCVGVMTGDAGLKLIQIFADTSEDAKRLVREELQLEPLGVELVVPAPEWLHLMAWDHAAEKVAYWCQVAPIIKHMLDEWTKKASGQ